MNKSPVYSSCKCFFFIFVAPRVFTTFLLRSLYCTPHSPGSVTFRASICFTSDVYRALFKFTLCDGRPAARVYQIFYSFVCLTHCRNMFEYFTPVNFNCCCDVSYNCLRHGHSYEQYVRFPYSTKVSLLV